MQRGASSLRFFRFSRLIGFKSSVLAISVFYKNESAILKHSHVDMLIHGRMNLILNFRVLQVASRRRVTKQPLYFNIILTFR